MAVVSCTEYFHWSVDFVNVKSSRTNKDVMTKSLLSLTWPLKVERIHYSFPVSLTPIITRTYRVICKRKLVFTIHVVGSNSGAKGSRCLLALFLIRSGFRVSQPCRTPLFGDPPSSSPKLPHIATIQTPPPDVSSASASENSGFFFSTRQGTLTTLSRRPACLTVLVHC